jgi:tetratricopeptide (TPR) repeat protein
MIAAGANQQLLANLLVALQQLGRTEEALETLDKLAPTPLSPELALQKADLLFTLGRYQEAADLYRKIAATAGGKQRDRALRMAEYARAQLEVVDS